MNALKRTIMTLLPALLLLACAARPAVAQRQDPLAPATTYQDVLQLLKSGLQEDALLDRLKQSPTLFTLDAAQVDELRQAGASDRVLRTLASGHLRSDTTGDITNLAVILDCSGSMQAKTPDGKTKMEVAKHVVTRLLQSIPDGLRLTFVIYGHNRQEACRAVQVVRPLGVLDATSKAELAQFIADLRPVGATPIALALRTAGQELAKADAGCGIVLFSDGKETCQGNPSADAAALARTLDLTFGLNVVGFDVTARERDALQEIARAGQGKYLDAQSSQELMARLDTIQQEIKQAAKPAVVVKVKRVGPVPVGTLMILPPQIEFPRLKCVRVVREGASSSPVLVARDLRGEITAYGQEISLSAAEKYDLLWMPEHGKPVPLSVNMSIAEGSVTRIQPEDHLGMVFVRGEDLPAPKSISVLREGTARNTVHVYRQFVQTADTFGINMLVPAGKYDLLLTPREGKRQVLAEGFDVQAGKITLIE
jgi:Mg-chelatase subunit ChlD